MIFKKSLESTRMIIKKSRSPFIYSLLFHCLLFFILSLMLLENKTKNNVSHKALYDVIKNLQNRQEQDTHNIQKQTEADDQTPDLARFVVPAPVVYYGNQAMMNMPTPIKGSATGTSSFDKNQSTLPTPAVQQVAQEQIKPSSERYTQEAQSIPQESATIQETLPTEILSATSYIFSDNAFVEKTGPAKKLTLADLFKNAPADISQFAKEGQKTATQAGTENGDVNGSGQQITIKEGDMKYYTLWAKFLNHLNQAARFNRRGKEHIISQLLHEGKIEYLLQCGITIDASGNLIDIAITHSSGSRRFDELCKADIHAAVPFPPLPASLNKKTACFEVSVYP